MAELPEEEARPSCSACATPIFIGGAEDTGEEKAEDKVEVLLQAIAAAASDETCVPRSSRCWPNLQESGWMLTDAVHRIWAGERDAEALTAGLDEQDAALVARILEIIEKGATA